ncbi:sensor histidine kinase [Aquabacterium sp.]|uniref:sensor histidine kinase n=1 Tax=Aquabacterium sp. TaxID=1872578 RepID=UPI002D0A3732|nr:ATP-binding protein [Aquabacterium sp.]HSW07793.1 ATP-binding protein [Aquabacterium sp.]
MPVLPVPPDCTLPMRPQPETAGRVQRIRQAWRQLLLALMVLLLCTPAAQAQTLVFLQALTTTAQPGSAVDWAQARLLPLPDDWSISRPHHSGVVTYRLNFDVESAAGGGTLYALYIERACSALDVVVNGQLAYRGGRMSEPVSRNCQQPQLVPIPAGMLVAKGNAIDLLVRGFSLAEVGSAQRAGGLSRVELGPHDVLAQRHQWRMAFAIRLPEIVSGTLVLMGSFMFVMGWLNRKQSYLAYFGALMLGWALVLSRLWLTDLPWSHRSSELLLAGLMSLITLAAVQFLMRYADRRFRWLDIGLPLQCVVMGASLLAAGPQRLHGTTSAWFTLLSLEITAAAAFYLVDSHRRRPRQLWLMGPLLAVVGVALATEFLALQAQADARIGFIAQLVPSLVFLALGLRLVQQYGRALESAEQGRAELEIRIREATAQIERNFAQLSELKVEQVTERERKRIAADLHDDLGAKLLTIVHTSNDERISTLAREALEEMRLSVRGLTGKPVRLSDALGDWRAEVISRLAQSGVEGEWSSPPDDDVTGTLSARAFVQTTRILREAVSNIIKHSGASHCSVRCGIAEGDFQLVIQDNGNGIPLELDGKLDKGHGMASMKSRAKQLQGQCLVESGPGYGTVIRLTLPLDRHVTAA